MVGDSVRIRTRQNNRCLMGHKSYLIVQMYFLVIAAILIALVCSASAQVLRPMEVTEVPEGESVPYIVTNTEEAILIVHSTIRQMQFESTNPILQVDDDGGGEYILHLRPGTNVIKFKADGFVSVQERFVIGKKKYKEVRVVPKRGAGEKVETGTVEFEMNPGPTLVVQDGVQIGELHIGSSGVLKMNLPPGQHVLRFIRIGEGSYETKINVRAGVSQRETAQFVAGETEQLGVSGQTGVLYAKSEPSGASVYVDGVSAGITPLQLREIAAGEHVIRLEKAMYRPVEKQLEIAVDVVSTVSEELAPDFGELSMDTHPTGAELSVDGKYVGSTPYRISMLLSGTHTLALRKPNFHDVTWSLMVDPGVDIDTVISLPPAFGSLVITGNPNGASVYLDNLPIGQTPIRRDTVSSGRYAVRVEKELYSPLETTVTIQDNLETEIDTPLEENFGTVSVLSHPAGIEVKLAGTEIALGETPLCRNLQSGEYTIILENQYFEPYSYTAILQPGDSVIIDAGTMVRKMGTLRVFTDPPEADIYIAEELVGTSPLIVQWHTGEFSVKAILEGYAVENDDVTIRHEATAVVDLALTQSGALEFAVTPSDATVSVDGRSVSGSELGNLRPGLHSLRVEAQGYQTFEQDVRVLSNDTAKVTVALRELGGTVRIVASNGSTFPKGTKAQIDGVRMIGLEVSGVSSGSRRLTVSVPDYYEKEVQIHLENGEEKVVGIELSTLKPRKPKPTSFVLYSSLGYAFPLSDWAGWVSSGTSLNARIGVPLRGSAAGFEVGLRFGINDFRGFSGGPAIAEYDSTARITDFMLDIRYSWSTEKSGVGLSPFVGVGFGATLFSSAFPDWYGSVPESDEEPRFAMEITLGACLMFSRSIGTFGEARCVMAPVDGSYNDEDVFYLPIQLGLVLAL